MSQFSVEESEVLTAVAVVAHFCDVMLLAQNMKM
jgi:hypothetical protein